MLMSCILAFFLNYCIFLNTTLNSAVTQTICGNLKVCSPMNLFILLSFLIHLAGSILQLEKVQSNIYNGKRCLWSCGGILVHNSGSQILCFVATGVE